MKKTALILLLALASQLMFSQTPVTFDGKDVPQNVLGVYKLYPSADEIKPLKEKRRFHPVYLTHYGRHGSRYVRVSGQYDNVEKVLRLAHESGKLSPDGERMWADYSAAYPSLKGKTNNLTPLGREQHRGIAYRMTRNFPELFGPGTRVEAIASPYSRTEQSMDSFCSELSYRKLGTEIVKSPAGERFKALNPYSAKAGVTSDWDDRWNGTDAPFKPSVNELSEKLVKCGSFSARIFNDPAWVSSNVDVRTLMYDLYCIAIDLPNTPMKDTDLCKYFMLEELQGLSRVDNYDAHCCKGRCDGFGSKGRQWALSAYILEDMIELAKSDIASGEYRVRLRFGHDGCLMGMFALLGIDPWACSGSDSETLAATWDSSLTPMGCNLQVIVYENPKGKQLVRVLYNEEDFDLPIRKVRRYFYRADDLLEYCQDRLDDAWRILAHQ